MRTEERTAAEFQVKAAFIVANNLTAADVGRVLSYSPNVGDFEVLAFDVEVYNMSNTLSAQLTVVFTVDGEEVTVTGTVTVIGPPTPAPPTAPVNFGAVNSSSENGATDAEIVGVVFAVLIAAFLVMVAVHVHSANNSSSSNDAQSNPANNSSSSNDAQSNPAFETLSQKPVGNVRISTSAITPAGAAAQVGKHTLLKESHC